MKKQIHLCIPFSKIDWKHPQRVGGKAASLARLSAEGITVPSGCCILTGAYTSYLHDTRLKERILMEMNRKAFEEMRWEEMWDASLRIRNLFLKTSLPSSLHGQLYRELKTLFESRPVVVRSSAPGEDAKKSSFAGLHESFVNVTGAEMIIDKIRLVWASLWSDAALLYRKELSLDIAESSMAVVIQEFVPGECSGVVFSENPQQPSQAIIESVWGLNQGLVDGTIEPDRWIVDRKTRKVIEEYHPLRTHYVVNEHSGTSVSNLPSPMAEKPPLKESHIQDIFQLALKVEELNQCPQDLEWTFRNNTLYLLQARPITASVHENQGDTKSWYLGLRRNVNNLQNLRKKIEIQLIPRMKEESALFDDRNPAHLSNGDLAQEIRNRKEKVDYWTSVYWEECIPFAHGVRLFGQFYNDTLRPDDPFEFIDLLQDTQLESMKRNALLADIARQIQNINTKKLQEILAGSPDADPTLVEKINRFMRDTGIAFAGLDQGDAIQKFFLEFATHALSPKKPVERAQKIDRFFSHFSSQEQETVRELLDLAQASYRLRDDDNIYLGRFNQALEKALSNARSRLKTLLSYDPQDLSQEETALALEDPKAVEKPSPKPAHLQKNTFRLRTRQVTGQPACAGVATGIARVLSGPADILEFRNKEILVCDAIDPTMTFLVPLSSAIVERRGGMLIHGAIIAREYGVPCVTGVASATESIRTGTRVTVDGYLGIVTIYGEDTVHQT